MSIKSVVLTATAAVLLPVASGAAMAEKLTVGLPSAHGFFGLHLYVAEEKGFLNGVELEYQVLKGGSEVLKQVASGAITIGYAQPTEIMIQMAAKGEPLPLKFWYMLESHSANQIAVLEDSPIQTIADMKGKAIGISSPTASNVVQFRSVLELTGINPDKDVIWRAVGLGPGHLQALKVGTVQVSATNNMRHNAFEFSGVKLRVIPIEATKNFFGNGLFSSTKMIDTNADALTLVAKGVTRAIEHCNTDPAGCVAIMYKRFPELQSGELDAEGNLKLGLTQVMARNASTALRADQNGVYGYFPDSVWTATIDFMEATGEVKKRPEASVFFTNAIANAAAK